MITSMTGLMAERTFPVMASAPAPLGRPAAFGQFFKEQVAVVALNFDGPVLNGAARATALFQFFGQGFQPDWLKGQTADNRYSFAFSSFCFTSDFDAAFSRNGDFFLPTAAGGSGLVTICADPSMVGRIDGRRILGFDVCHFPASG